MKKIVLTMIALGTLTLTNCGKETETVIERVEVQKGSQILSGDGAPNASLGSVGDYYLDKGTMNLYGAKTADGWGTPASLKGIQGEKGKDGKDGANGTNGSDGQNGTNGTNGKDGATILSGTTAPVASQGKVGDWFIDTQNKLLYGPKTESGWGSGISLSGSNGSSISQKADFLVSDDGTTLLQWRNKNTETIDMTVIPELANVTKIGNRAFEGCEELTSLKLTDKITSVGHYAFSYCYKLEEVHFPKNVTTLGNYLFDRAGNVKNVYIEAITPPTFILNNTGGGNNRLDLGYYSHTIENFYVPASALNVYKTNEQWKKLTDITEYDPNTHQQVVKGTKLKPIQ